MKDVSPKNDVNPKKVLCFFSDLIKGFKKLLRYFVEKVLKSISHILNVSYQLHIM